jgi:hypothetical protein
VDDSEIEDIDDVASQQRAMGLERGVL